MRGSGTTDHYTNTVGVKAIQIWFFQILLTLLNIFADLKLFKLQVAENLTCEDLMDLSTHPCDHNTSSCVVIALPYQHLLLGCMDDHVRQLPTLLKNMILIREKKGIYENMMLIRKNEYDFNRRKGKKNIKRDKGVFFFWIRDILTSRGFKGNLVWPTMVFCKNRNRGVEMATAVLLKMRNQA